MTKACHQAETFQFPCTDDRLIMHVLPCQVVQSKMSLQSSAPTSGLSWWSQMPRPWSCSSSAAQGAAFLPLAICLGHWDKWSGHPNSNWFHYQTLGKSLWQLVPASATSKDTDNWLQQHKTKPESSTCVVDSESDPDSYIPSIASHLSSLLTSQSTISMSRIKHSSKEVPQGVTSIKVGHVNTVSAFADS